MEVKGMRLRSIEPELRKAETRRGLHITSSRESIDCVIETHSRCQLPQNKASRVQNIEAPTRLHMACRRPWDKKIIVRYASQRAHRQRHETPQEPAGKGVESPNEGGLRFPQPRRSLFNTTFASALKPYRQSEMALIVLRCAVLSCAVCLCCAVL